MSENRDVAYLLLDLADEHPRLAPVHRRAARLLLTTTTEAAPDDGCERCGTPVENLSRGRPASSAPSAALAEKS
ncbi:MAG: hypothetical protein U5K30_01465 [Acidimicrobiales bacterium]|nr:hypothetical protein [Acidimicrobiales bacterium]